MLRDLWQDLKFAFRNLRSQKAVAFMAILSLSLSISMVTGIYSQIESTMLKRTPGVGDPDGLTSLLQSQSFPDYEKIRDSSGQFREVAAYLPKAPVMLSARGEKPDRRWAHLVTTNYFELFRAGVAMGRPLGAEDRQGAEPSMVISHRLWKERFGADRSIVGRAVQVNGRPVTVVGIAEPDFRGASPMMAAADVWLPVTIGSTIAPELGNGLLEKRLARFRVVGRLSPEIVPAQAEAALDTLVRNSEMQAGDASAKRDGRRVTLLPGGRIFPVRDEDLVVSLAMPTVLTGLMLWIACANVATMILAKSLARRREIGIRLAMGASRGRLVRQLLTESALLAVIGGVIGIGWAFWSMEILDVYKPVLPSYVELSISISWMALLITLGASVITGVLFGLTPALQATQTDLSSALKGAVAPVKMRWWSSRNLLVLQQVAASLALLMLTGFVVIGFNRSSGGDLGFEAANLYEFSLDPLRDGYSEDRTVRLFETLVEDVRRIPGVENVAIAERSPTNLGQNSEMMASQSSVENMRQELQSVRVDRVGPGFFATAGVPMIYGREFRDSDVNSGQALAVVNQEMAQKRWAGRDPVGETAEIAGKKYRVVGVAKTIRSGAIINISHPSAYLLLDRESLLRPLPEGMAILLRAKPSFNPITAVRRMFEAREPDLTVFEARPVLQQIDSGRTIVRLVSYTYGGIGVYGLLLAAVGLVGVTAQAVVRRTKEIGIRMALGASAKDVWGLVMREGIVLTVVGAAFGIAAAFAMTRVLSTFISTLSDVTKTTMTDPLLLVGAPLLLCVLTLAACLGPSLRATRITPMSAIREE